METYQYNFTTITKGICSAETVEKLATRECQKYLATQSNKIYSTLYIIMYNMCAADEIPTALDGLRKQFTRQQNVSRNSTDKIAPIGIVLDLDDGIVFTNLRPGKY